MGKQVNMTISEVLGALEIARKISIRQNVTISAHRAITKKFNATIIVITLDEDVSLRCWFSQLLTVCVHDGFNVFMK